MGLNQDLLFWDFQKLRTQGGPAKQLTYFSTLRDQSEVSVGFLEMGTYTLLKDPQYGNAHVLTNSHPDPHLQQVIYCNCIQICTSVPKKTTSSLRTAHRLHYS